MSPALLMADVFRGDDSEPEAEPVVIEVRDRTAWLTLDDGTALVVQLEQLRDALGWQEAEAA